MGVFAMCTSILQRIVHFPGPRRVLDLWKTRELNTVELISLNSCVLSMHRFIYGIEYGEEMRLKNLEHHRFCHNHYSNVREQGRGQPHCRKLHLFTPSFQVTGSFSPTALNRTKNSNVLRRMAPSQSLSDHFRYAPREHTTFLHPYTTNNACSIRRGGCHECSFTSVAESHFRVRIVLKKKIAKISVSLDGTLEDGLNSTSAVQTPVEVPFLDPFSSFESRCTGKITKHGSSPGPALIFF